MNLGRNNLFEREWIRASASQSVDLGFIPYIESYQKTLQNSIHSIKKDIMEIKPASLVVASLGKALNRMPPSLCGRQVAYPYFTVLQLCGCSPSMSSEATLGYPPMVVRLVGGGATSHS